MSTETRSGGPLYAQINGIRIAYECTGQGYPLLLLHGFPRTRHLWSKVTPALASRFTVVCPDRRGYGDSERPSDPATYDNATMTQDALELTRHLGWKDFVVIGHDKGAPAAQRLAADYPEIVRGAMILDGGPAGAGGPPRRDPTGRGWYLDFFRQRGVAEKIIGQNPALFFSLFLDRNPHLSPEEHQFYVEAFSRPGTVDAILADYRASSEVDPQYWEERFKEGRKISTPIYAIWGDQGPSGNAPVLENWRKVAENVQGEVVTDSGHYLQEQQPEAIVHHIMRFADQLGLP